ncbi:MAG: transposase [Treponema sp.]|jgi:hypothetical protein|nr:transposase [Treponema sp.]
MVVVVHLFLGGPKEGGIGDMRVNRRIDGRYEGVRIRALRKDGKSGQAGLKRLVKENWRKRGGKAVSELQRENNKYIIVAASLGMGVSAEQVMELHRMRWQIELAFKRLKSLFRCNDPPAGNGESVKAWLGNCRLPPCVRHWRAWGGFPPGRDMAAGKRSPRLSG